MNNDQAMASAEEAYLTEPEYRARCESCQTILKNGVCSNCDADDYNPDERVD